MTEQSWIHIKGAREHNLKGIEVRLPRGKLTVMTGVSGSGKSSLAFDTLYAEGFRKYLDSLSTQARQAIEQIKRPDVDYITGLSPVIAVEQRTTGATNPRSTVATATEIADYARLLWAVSGQAFCPQDGGLIERRSMDDCLASVFGEKEGSRLMILAPVEGGDSKNIIDQWPRLRLRGFQRVRLDGEICDLEDPPFPNEEQAEKNSSHTLEVIVDRLVLREDQRSRLADSLELAFGEGHSRALIMIQEEREAPWRELRLSQDLACVACGKVYPPITPQSFSYNHPQGACSHCQGLGQMDDSPCADCRGQRLRPASLAVRLNGIGFADFMDLSVAEALECMKSCRQEDERARSAADALDGLEQRLHFLKEVGLGYLQLVRTYRSLSGGEAQRVRLAGQLGMDLVGVTYVLDEPSIGLHPHDNAKLLKTLLQLRDRGNTLVVVEHDAETLLEADYLVELGPGAGELGGELCYAGAPKDCETRTGAFLQGKASIAKTAATKTFNKASKVNPGLWLSIKQAMANNLKAIDVDFPIGSLTCVTGVSGSGKSTLINDILAPIAARRLNRAQAKAGAHKSIQGLEHFQRLVQVDQSPIGRSPRSNPATYLKIFDLLRAVFAKCPLAKQRGYLPRRFSFNVPGGRCERCQGAGSIALDMQFLADVYVSCPSCEGRRYNRSTLEIRFKGLTIAEVLELTISEALELFDKHPQLSRKLQGLVELGLGYIRLGQPATTLSGGEAQRLKLAFELTRGGQQGQGLYLLDEPTTGLHWDDVQRLMDLLFDLRDAGNTLIVIEHHTDVIRLADWIIDLGPDGGEAGGELIYTGSAERIKNCSASRTGKAIWSLTS